MHGRRGGLGPCFTPTRYGVTKIHGALVAEPFTRLAGQRVQSEEATIESDEENAFVQLAPFPTASGGRVSLPVGHTPILQRAALAGGAGKGLEYPYRLPRFCCQRES